MSKYMPKEKISRNKPADNRKIIVFSKIFKFLVFVNLIVVLILKFFSKGVTHTATPTIWFYISLIITIIIFIISGKKNFIKRKLFYGIIVIIYIVLIIFLPVYKVNGQESVIDDSKTNYKNFAGVDYIITYEKTVGYTDYFNLYGANIKRDINDIKNN